MTPHVAGGNSTCSAASAQRRVASRRCRSRRPTSCPIWCRRRVARLVDCAGAGSPARPRQRATHARPCAWWTRLTRRGTGSTRRALQLGPAVAFAGVEAAWRVNHARLAVDRAYAYALCTRWRPWGVPALPARLTRTPRPFRRRPRRGRAERRRTRHRAPRRVHGRLSALHLAGLIAPGYRHRRLFERASETRCHFGIDGLSLTWPCAARMAAPTRRAVELARYEQAVLGREEPRRLVRLARTRTEDGHSRRASTALARRNWPHISSRRVAADRSRCWTPSARSCRQGRIRRCAQRSAAARWRCTALAGGLPQRCRLRVRRCRVSAAVRGGPVEYDGRPIRESRVASPRHPTREEARRRAHAAAWSGTPRSRGR